jgi:hypothetical protein
LFFAVAGFQDPQGTSSGFRSPAWWIFGQASVDVALDVLDVEQWIMNTGERLTSDPVEVGMIGYC